MANELNGSAKIKAELEVRRVARAMRAQDVDVLMETAKQQVKFGKVTDVFGSMVLDEFTIGEFEAVKDMSYWALSKLTEEIQKTAAPVNREDYTFIVNDVWERTIDLVEKSHSDRVKEKLEQEVKPSYLQIAASAWKIAANSEINLGQEDETQLPEVAPRTKSVLNAGGIALMRQELQHASKGYQSSGIEELFTHGIQQKEAGIIEDIFGHMANDLSREEFRSLLELVVDAIDNLDYLLADKQEKTLTKEGLLDDDHGIVRMAWNNAMNTRVEMPTDAKWAEECFQFVQRELFTKIWDHCEKEQQNANKGRG